MKRSRRSGRPAKKAEPLGIKALDQALELLSLVAAKPEAISLTELSRASEMPTNKLHRYLVSFCRVGLISQGADGFYALGRGAIQLGGLALSRLDELLSLEPLLDEVVATLDESVFLYVWTSAGPVLIRSRRPSYSAVTLRIGTIAPMIGSASGPIFAAYIPRGETEAVAHRDFRSAGVDEDRAAIDLYDVKAPRIRNDRFYLSDTTLIPNSGACAAPVFDAQGELLHVVGVSIRGVGAKRPREEIAFYLRDLAQQMSYRIGFLE